VKSKQHAVAGRPMTAPSDDRSKRVRAGLLAPALAWLLLGAFVTPASADLYDDDFTDATIIGNSLPGDWRPFSDASPWNTEIQADSPTHPENIQVMQELISGASHVRLSNSYMPPLWVVNANNMPHPIAESPYPFDAWDQDLDGVTEAGAPVMAGMYGEPTPDGHIIVVDPFRRKSWEMSYFRGLKINGRIDCSTFNVWDLDGTGVGDGNEGVRHYARGGRGSGFPVIAGLVRPEELELGEIRHALVFTYPRNRQGVFVPPAARTDGSRSGSQYPMEGMRLQLDPTLTEADFNAWGLGPEAKVVARALQKYGMFDGDNGGAMSIQVQHLGPTASDSRDEWDSRFPGFYNDMSKIPTNKFRVLYTGDAVSGGSRSRVVQPLILPIGGTVAHGSHITISISDRDARITYTLDGSTPLSTSTDYTGPISVSALTVVRAKAFRSGKTPSPTTSATFGVDTSNGIPLEGCCLPPAMLGQ